METTRFDAITSTFAARSTRRGALRSLAAMALGVGGLTVLGHDAGQAKKQGKKKRGGKGTGGTSSSTPSTPSSSGGSGGGPSMPADMCPVAAKTNAPVCGNDPDGACDCHRSMEGNNFCGGFLTTCAGLRPCTSTADCRESVGFHFVCQAADGGGCGQVCVPACENRDPYP